MKGGGSLACSRNRTWLRTAGCPGAGVMRRYERGSDGWHDGLLMDLLPEDLNS